MSWVVADADAPLGEWWVAKCCGRVLDSPAKVGGHRCAGTEQPWERDRRRVLVSQEREASRAKYAAERAARAAERAARATRPWYRFW